VKAGLSAQPVSNHLFNAQIIAYVADQGILGNVQNRHARRSSDHADESTLRIEHGPSPGFGGIDAKVFRPEVANLIQEEAAVNRQDCGRWHLGVVISPCGAKLFVLHLSKLALNQQPDDRISRCHCNLRAARGASRAPICLKAGRVGYGHAGSPSSRLCLGPEQDRVPIDEVRDSRQKLGDAGELIGIELL
jgi:hypothetical protein